MSQRLLRSTVLVGGMTLVSRIFGYVRDAVIFVSFGVSGATDAFFVAFRIPNLLRRLFAEGAFSQAFVPVFSEYKTKHDPAALHTLVDHVTGSLTLILSGITALGILAAPVLILIFAPGFIDNPARFDLATSMLRITFPYLFFISLTALAGSILNSFGRFAVPAFTPTFLNIAMIGATLWIAPHLDKPITALAWGVLIAGVAQLAFQLPFLARLGLLPRLRPNFHHPGVRKILKLMLPALFGSSVMQVNLLFDTLIASFLATGSISWLYASDRFVELPLALFGVATATVILPRLAHQYAIQSQDGFAATLEWALRLSVLIAIPAMLGLILLSGPILSTLVQYREFTVFDMLMARLSLIAYGLGLPAFILIKILAPGFYARQDTTTPVKVGVAAMLANMGLNVIIVGPWTLLDIPGAHAGLALSTTLSAYLNAGLLFFNLRRKGIYRPGPGWGRLILQTSLATAAMMAALALATPALSEWTPWSAPTRLLALLGLFGLGTVCYTLVLFTLGIRVRHFATE